MAVKRGFDAIVVGAGIAGTASAYYLRQAGFSVALVDMHHPGWGASGRNPGFLWLQTKAAGLAMDFSLAGRRFAETLAGEMPDFGFRASGGLITWRDDVFEPVVRAFVADRVAAGLPVSLLDRPALRDLCPDISPEVSGAVWNPLDAHQDTRLLVRHLADAFQDGGGSIVAPARIASLVLTGSTCRGVRLADGAEIESGVVVVAAGPWSNLLLEPLGLGISSTPTRFEAAETAPAPFRIKPVISGQSLFRFFTPPGIDATSLPREPVELLRPELGFTGQIASFPDGSLQFGCAYEIGSDDDRATVAGQAMACSIMSRNFQAMASLPILRQWAGIVAQTPDGLPFIDAASGPEGLILNTGHFFGNLAGAFSGRIVAQLASGQELVYPVEGFSRRRFTGGDHVAWGRDVGRNDPTGRKHADKDFQGRV
ncbi:FAD-dependent oxidoreductase [Mesorhizobium sp. B2-4-6]|uniref:NAD(P)/FAD-dependent oxidoreductase n=1 Tax=Mesorhizobium sp. B2-4-6 TaxID=2589943 RepID=UPI0015E30FFE|nr:FAD-dependent oxidoreductase [Mesorhizobium sp. B2-4-6]